MIILESNVVICSKIEDRFEYDLVGLFSRRVFYICMREGIRI